jgi:hypothetical protein
MFRINGARGGAMFFFGLMSLIFGWAFSGPFKVIPPPPPGLTLLHNWVPLEIWGIGWILAGVFLIIGAFRQNQSWGMAIYSSMLFIWFASYLTTALVSVFTKGYATTGMWYAAAVYGALLGAVICVARLLNAPPSSHLQAVVTGEVELVMKKESGDDG